QDQRDAKRDNEAKEWREEQARREAKLNNVLLNLQEQQGEIRAGIKDMVTMLSPQNRLAYGNTGALCSALRSGSAANNQRADVSWAKSEATSHNGTPQKNIPRPKKFDREWYCQLSKDYKSSCQEVGLSDGLGMISKEWSQAWDNIDNASTLRNSPNAKKILSAYRNNKGVALLNHQSASEPIYQTAFDHLAKAVEQLSLTNSSGESTGLRWVDTHKIRVSGGGNPGRYPDGGFFTAKSAQGTQWHDMVAVIEIKKSKDPADSDNLRGQIMQGLIDMATFRPRRFSFGISLGNGGKIYVYICVPDNIYVALLVELPGAFALDKIVGIESDKKDTSMNTSINIRTPSGGEVLGRHRSLEGPRTWIYPSCRFDYQDAVLKFQWIPEGNLESEVHRFVLAKGVPHVPKLLFAAGVSGRQSDRDVPFVGEVLVFENVGNKVSSLFDSAGSSMEKRVVDIFAAYAHTLIAAARIGKDNRFVLHRDISLGNLMVTHSGQPYIIDWGYGCVCDSSICHRPASGKVIVGTTIYMSIRVLFNKETRSLIDDLESLFLVFCHCLWTTYGNTRNEYYKDLWVKGNKLQVELVRKDWLSSKLSLFKHMEAGTNIPVFYRRLAKGMYDQLFPSRSFISFLEENSNDPRVEKFKSSNWMNLFEKAVDNTAAMPYLKMLQDYVAAIENDSRRISFIAEKSNNADVLVVTPDHDKDTSEDYNVLESPTQNRGLKRASTSIFRSATAKNRRR
ncbi:hypothetical protein H4217_006556, partial [Coemansia sp. RSA 1939]